MISMERISKKLSSFLKEDFTIKDEVLTGEGDKSPSYARDISNWMLEHPWAYVGKNTEDLMKVAAVKDAMRPLGLSVSLVFSSESMGGTSFLFTDAERLPLFTTPVRGCWNALQDIFGKDFFKISTLLAAFEKLSKDNDETRISARLVYSTQQNGLCYLVSIVDKEMGRIVFTLPLDSYDVFNELLMCAYPEPEPEKKEGEEEAFDPYENYNE